MPLLDLQGLESMADSAKGGHGHGPSNLSVLICGTSGLSVLICT